MSSVPHALTIFGTSARRVSSSRSAETAWAGTIARNKLAINSILKGLRSVIFSSVLWRCVDALVAGERSGVARQRQAKTVRFGLGLGPVLGHRRGQQPLLEYG